MAKINSGIAIWKKLKESGTGPHWLQNVLGAFECDRAGNPKRDIPAKDLLEYMDEQPHGIIPDQTKVKARAFHKFGRYDPPAPEIFVTNIDELVLPETEFEDGEVELPAEEEVTPKRGRKPKQ